MKQKTRSLRDFSRSRGPSETIDEDAARILSSNGAGVAKRDSCGASCQKNHLRTPGFNVEQYKAQRKRTGSTVGGSSIAAPAGDEDPETSKLREMLSDPYTKLKKCMNREVLGCICQETTMKSLITASREIKPFTRAVAYVQVRDIQCQTERNQSYEDVNLRIVYSERLHNAGGGYALTLACNHYAKEIELLPNLQPLRKGDAVIGSNGSYYMGGVNHGDRLSKPFVFRSFDEMLEEDAPSVAGEPVADDDESNESFVWLSDEFAGGPDFN
ncbi:hypothetical protein C8R45DRAFT_920274 [Mycena sanguinolenta]|nr:hypothetical protein C8R45DRAFT_920274 [Mycena sanguinolenta]